MKSNPNTSHVNVPAHKMNHVTKRGDMQQDQPASMPDAQSHGPHDVAGKSQIARPGESRGHNPRLTEDVLNKHQKRSKKLTTRSENGMAEKGGGY
jgi:hypothetical protein